MRGSVWGNVCVANLQVSRANIGVKSVTGFSAQKGVKSLIVKGKPGNGLRDLMPLQLYVCV